MLDQVNTTGTVFLGLTVGCAQCHSHKFDPLSQREYYGLYAFFDSAGISDFELASPAEKAARDAAQAKVDALKKARNRLRGDAQRDARRLGSGFERRGAGPIARAGSIGAFDDHARAFDRSDCPARGGPGRSSILEHQAMSREIDERAKEVPRLAVDLGHAGRAARNAIIRARQPRAARGCRQAGRAGIFASAAENRSAHADRSGPLAGGARKSARCAGHDQSDLAALFRFGTGRAVQRFRRADPARPCIRRSWIGWPPSLWPARGA